MTQKTGTTKEKKHAYKKPKFFGDQANRYGLRYFQVDTCCTSYTGPLPTDDSTYEMGGICRRE